MAVITGRTKYREVPFAISTVLTGSGLYYGFVTLGRGCMHRTPLYVLPETAEQMAWDALYQMMDDRELGDAVEVDDAAQE